jgi:hypothetical protein
VIETDIFNVVDQIWYEYACSFKCKKKSLTVCTHQLDWIFYFFFEIERFLMYTQICRRTWLLKKKRNIFYGVCFSLLV